jgi:hypothetical protein
MAGDTILHVFSREIPFFPVFFFLEELVKVKFNESEILLNCIVMQLFTQE